MPAVSEPSTIGATTFQENEQAGLHTLNPYQLEQHMRHQAQLWQAQHNSQAQQNQGPISQPAASAPMFTMQAQPHGPSKSLSDTPPGFPHGPGQLPLPLPPPPPSPAHTMGTLPTPGGHMTDAQWAQAAAMYNTPGVREHYHHWLAVQQNGQQAPVSGTGNLPASTANSTLTGYAPAGHFSAALPPAQSATQAGPMPPMPPMAPTPPQSGATGATGTVAETHPGSQHPPQQQQRGQDVRPPALPDDEDSGGATEPHGEHCHENFFDDDDDNSDGHSKHERLLRQYRAAEREWAEASDKVQQYLAVVLRWDGARARALATMSEARSAMQQLQSPASHDGGKAGPGPSTKPGGGRKGRGSGRGRRSGGGSGSGGGGGEIW